MQRTSRRRKRRTSEQQREPTLEIRILSLVDSAAAQQPEGGRRSPAKRRHPHAAALPLFSNSQFMSKLFTIPVCVEHTCFHEAFQRSPKASPVLCTVAFDVLLLSTCLYITTGHHPSQQ